MFHLDRVAQEGPKPQTETQQHFTAFGLEIPSSKLKCQAKFEPDVVAFTSVVGCCAEASCRLLTSPQVVVSRDLAQKSF